MTRFISDQNKVVLLHESGTYANTSGNGYWIGQIEDNSIDDMEGKIETRYLGAATRSFSQMIPGPRDVKGTMTFAPQDMRIPFWAIGSVVDGGTGSANTHIATQVQTNVQQSAFTSGTLNAPISFTIEDSKQVTNGVSAGQNFIRTIKGCVINNVKITANQGAKVKVDCDYIGQNLTEGSGATTSVTQSSSTPYLWNNCTLTMAGSAVNTAREVVIEIKQNMEAPHYINGSRDISVPFQKNRENNMTVKLDLDSQISDMLYNNLYKTNTLFNTTFDMNADQTTGSQHTILFLSGCYITKMMNPSKVEGSVESDVELRCPIIVGSSFDTTSKYNPW